MRIIFLLCIFAVYVAAGTGTNKISKFFDESVQAELDASPFLVVLQQSKISGNIQAIITNRGKTAYYLTQNTPLSTEPTERNIRLYNENDEHITFLGPEGQHRIPDPTRFQRLESGTSVVREVKIIDKYAISPNEQYYVQAAGFVAFYREGQTPHDAQSQFVMYEANVLEFTAPETVRLNTRAIQNQAATGVVYKGCKDAKMDGLLTKTAKPALEVVQKTLRFIEEGKGSEIWNAWFKADDPETRQQVKIRFKALEKQLLTNDGPITFQCADSDFGAKYCKQAGAMAFADVDQGRAQFCPISGRYPLECKRCDDGNQAGTLIHEMTHLRAVFNPPTVDNAQHPPQCKALSKAKALLNANSYNLFSQNVILGKC